MDVTNLKASRPELRILNPVWDLHVHYGWNPNMATKPAYFIILCKGLPTSWIRSSYRFATIRLCLGRYQGCTTWCTQPSTPTMDIEVLVPTNSHRSATVPSFLQMPSCCSAAHGPKGSKGSTLPETKVMWVSSKDPTSDWRSSSPSYASLRG